MQAERRFRYSRPRKISKSRDDRRTSEGGGEYARDSIVGSPSRASAEELTDLASNNLLIRLAALDENYK